jgi:predicted type IV restriction endonuclease
MVQTLQINDLSLHEVKQRFHLRQSLDPTFFPEWKTQLPNLTDDEQRRCDRIKQEFLAQSEYPLLEEAVKLIVVSPLLSIAGFYLPPFRIRPEATVQLTLADEDKLLRGRIDILVVQQQLWILVIESKEAGFSLLQAIPQALAYMLANSDRDRPNFALCTNGSHFLFLKQQGDQYAESDEFSLRRHQNELWQVTQILKHLGQCLIG